MFSQGFTFIELLVTIAISGVLLGLGIAAYNNFSESQKLVLVTRTLKTNLRSAQAKAMANKIPDDCSGFAGYLVSFKSDSYTIEASCAEGGMAQETYTLPSNIYLDGSPGPLLFKPRTTGTNLSGELVLTYKRVGTSETAQVTVTTSGEVK